MIIISVIIDGTIDLDLFKQFKAPQGKEAWKAAACLRVLLSVQTSCVKYNKGTQYTCLDKETCADKETVSQKIAQVERTSDQKKERKKTKE